MSPQPDKIDASGILNYSVVCEEHSVFEANPQITRASVIEHFKAIQSLRDLGDFKVEFRETTWESIYPDPIERERIKTAIETNVIRPEYTNTFPDVAKSFPYKHEIEYFIKARYVDEVNDYAYYERDPITAEELGYYACESNEEIVHVHKWTIECPRQYFDCYIKPIRPVQYITFDLTIKNPDEEAYSNVR